MFAPHPVTPPRRNPLTPRKIPQQSRAEHTVAAILEAVACVLETRGMAGLNTNRVAARAGVSIGSLYQYFPGKDALIVALCQRERAAFLAEASAALQAPTGQAAWRRLITASVHQQLRRPALTRLLDFEETRPAVARELAPFRAGMGALIGQLLARGDIPPPRDMALATGDLMAIVRGLVNAAGERGDVDAGALDAIDAIDDLERRIGRAVFGYLGLVVTAS